VSVFAPTSKINRGLGSFPPAPRNGDVPCLMSVVG